MRKMSMRLPLTTYGKQICRAGHKFKVIMLMHNHEQGNVQAYAQSTGNVQGYFVSLEIGMTGCESCFAQMHRCRCTDSPTPTSFSSPNSTSVWMVRSWASSRMMTLQSNRSKEGQTQQAASNNNGGKSWHWQNGTYKQQGQGSYLKGQSISG
jgi:hypothetical protein